MDFIAGRNPQDLGEDDLEELDMHVDALMWEAPKVRWVEAVQI
jgi:hypothetical protein